MIVGDIIIQSLSFPPPSSYSSYFISSIGFCKITLEVLSSNHPAKQLYAGAGFAPYELDPMAGHALFWQKKIQN
jgi:hypothetical protein